MPISKREDGFYFETSFKKVNQGNKLYLDTTQFFKDITELLTRFELDNKTENKVYKKYKSIKKRFNGLYFSPSLMKSFLENPALLVFSQLAEQDINSPAEIGTTFHTIMEKYYSLPKEKRDRAILNNLLDESLKEGQQRELVSNYVSSFINTRDYLSNNPLDDTKLDCFCEYNGIDLVKIDKFDYTLPLELKFIADRIDIRDGKVYIIDYKTGKSMGKHSIETYKIPMILYKWAVEQQFSLDVEALYLLALNTGEYFKIEDNLVNESKVVEEVEKFARSYKIALKDNLFEYTSGGYKYSDEYKHLSNFMNSKDDLINVSCKL